MRPPLSADAACAVTAARVLIREDDSDFAEEMAQALRARGFVPSIFPEQRDIAGVFRRAAPDFLILDISAPPPDGFEILRFLRDYEGGRDIAIVLVSGAGAAMVQAATMLCAAYRLRLGGVFRKPVMAAALAGLMVRL
jgi:DNA-binding response OmpR family regulator